MGFRSWLAAFAITAACPVAALAAPCATPDNSAARPIAFAAAGRGREQDGDGHAGPQFGAEAGHG